MSLYLGKNSIKTYNSGQQSPFSLYNESTIVPKKENVIIPQNSLTKQELTIKGDNNLLPENIKKDINLWKQKGTLINQDTSNGTKWQYFTLEDNPIGSQMAYNEQIWINIGNNTVFYSSTGVEWTPTFELSYTDPTLTKIKTYHNMWIIYNTGQTGIYISYNGIDWTEEKSTNAIFNSLVYGAGYWVAATNIGILYSTDGIGWTAVSGTENTTYADLHYTNQLFVAIDKSQRGTIVYCDTRYNSLSSTWSSTVDNINQINDMFYDSVVSKYIIGASNGVFYRTKDETSWTRLSGVQGNCTKIIEGNGQIIFLIDNYIYIFNDISNAFSNSFTDDLVKDIACYNNIWIALSEGQNAIIYSYDGTTAGGMIDISTIDSNIDVSDFEKIYFNNNKWFISPFLWDVDEYYMQHFLYSHLYQPSIDLFGFWIDNNYYIAQKDMTWAQWCLDYDSYAFVAVSDDKGIRIETRTMSVEEKSSVVVNILNVPVDPDSLIEINGIYNLSLQ